MTKERKGRVIPFARNAQEVRGLALRQQAQGNPLAALELFRLSLERSPGDPLTLLQIAQTYANMGCYALSCGVYAALAYEEDYSATCFYGMGFNYYAMGVYSAAHDCMLLALQRAPDAEEAPDAVELLEAIELSGEITNPMTITLQRRMDRVLRAMDAGNVPLALRYLRRVLSLDKRNSGIHALRALALLAGGHAKQALAAARHACRLDKNDIRALCALASALKMNQSDQAARAYLHRAAEKIDSEDEAQLVCQTASEMREHAFVIAMLEKYETQNPYADEMLHMLAVAYYNADRREDALRCWRLLRRINPMDSIAAYRLQMATGPEPPVSFSYAQEVPLAEMLTRLEDIRHIVHAGGEALSKRWNADEAVESTIRWGLMSGEMGIPQAMCGVLTSIGDARCVTILKEMLCNDRITEAVKHSILAALHTIGAEGPFYAVVNDRLTMVHVSRAEEDRAPDADQDTARTLLRQARRYYQAPFDGQPLLRALANTAVGMPCELDPGTQARGVVFAYGMLTGTPSPLPSTFAHHRRAERFARRIVKEYQSHEMHKL